MKNLFYLLFLASLPIHAQDLPWLEVGSEWTYQHGHVGGPEHSQITFGIIEETTFAGKSCVKMERVPAGPGFPCGAVAPPYYYYVSNDSLFFAKSSDTNFQLVADFGASIGDTWIYSAGTSETATEYLVTVTDITTIEVNGTTLRKLHLNYFFDFESEEPYYVDITPTNIDIIEVIGSLQLFFTPIGAGSLCDMDTGAKLQCFDSPSLSYLNPIFPNCNFILSIEDTYSANDLSLFPNPTQSSVVLKGELLQNTEWVEIYNMLGASVKRHSIIHSGETIDLASLDSGMYLIRCFTKGNTIWTGKVVKK
jgi:hypothetical protein